MARKSVIEKVKSIKGKINPNYEMRTSHMTEIYNKMNGDSFKMIDLAFDYGYLQGTKAAKAETKKGGVISG